MSQEQKIQKIEQVSLAHSSQDDKAAAQLNFIKATLAYIFLMPAFYNDMDIFMDTLKSYFLQVVGIQKMLKLEIFSSDEQKRTLEIETLSLWVSEFHLQPDVMHFKKVQDFFGIHDDDLQFKDLHPSTASLKKIVITHLVTDEKRYSDFLLQANTIPKELLVRIIASKHENKIQITNTESALIKNKHNFWGECFRELSKIVTPYKQLFFKNRKSFFEKFQAFAKMVGFQKGEKLISDDIVLRVCEEGSFDELRLLIDAGEGERHLYNGTLMLLALYNLQNLNSVEKQKTFIEYYIDKYHEDIKRGENGVNTREMNLALIAEAINACSVVDRNNPGLLKFLLHVMKMREIDLAEVFTAKPFHAERSSIAIPKFFPKSKNANNVRVIKGTLDSFICIDVQGICVPHFLIQSQQFEHAQLFLENGCDFMIENENHYIPYLYATPETMGRWSRVLGSYGKNFEGRFQTYIKNVFNTPGKFPLIKALSEENMAIAIFLLKEGRSYQYVDNLYAWPTELFASIDVKGFETLDQYIRLADLLLKVNSDGTTLADFLFKKNNYSVIIYVFEKYAKELGNSHILQNKLNQDGDSFLHLYVLCMLYDDSFDCKPHEEMLKYLNINIRNKKKQTPIMKLFSVIPPLEEDKKTQTMTFFSNVSSLKEDKRIPQDRYGKIIDLLQSQGVDWHIMDDTGKSAKDYADAAGYAQYVERLLDENQQESVLSEDEEMGCSYP